MKGGACESLLVLRFAVDGIGRILWSQSPVPTSNAGKSRVVFDLSNVRYLDWRDFERMLSLAAPLSNRLFFVGDESIRDFIVLHGMQEAACWLPDLEAVLQAALLEPT